MERVQLGRSGLRVSPISFGTWQLSPRFWGEQSKDQITRAIRRAFDGGINLFDTADAYGDGHAETVLGEAIAGVPRDELVITTKVLARFKPDGSRIPDLSAENIAARCEVSLKRLQLDTIDLYLLHGFDPLTPCEETTGQLDRLRAQGKIRAYGVSNHSVEQFRAQRRFGDYSVVQPPYSLIDPAGEDDLLPYCQAEGIGVMVYSPLHKGLLSGKYRGTETFTDFRANHPDFQGERFAELCANVRSLGPIAERYELSIYQLALAATVQHPSIHTAICGIKTPEQIEEALGAAGTVLSREDLTAARAAVGPGSRRTADAGGVRK